MAQLLERDTHTRNRELDRDDDGSAMKGKRKQNQCPDVAFECASRCVAAAAGDVSYTVAA